MGLLFFVFVYRQTGKAPPVIASLDHLPTA